MNNKLNMFKELSAEFAQGLAKNFADKDAEIASLRNRVDELRKDQTAPVTYAQMTIGNRSRARNTDIAPSKIRQIERSKSSAKANKTRSVNAVSTAPPMAFILNTNGGSSEEAKTALWKTVSKKTKTPRLNLITTRAGKLIVKPQNKESADILKAISHKKPGVLNEDQPRRPRVIIRNLDASISSEDIPTVIATQNPELGTSEELASEAINPIFKRGSRDAPTINWICDIEPSRYHSLINKSVFIGFYKCRVDRFEELTQCFKCLQFGHTAKRCNKPEEVCSHCAQSGHKVVNCPKKDEMPKCINCGGLHQGTDPTCSKRAITLANRQRRTDYGNIEKKAMEVSDVTNTR